MAQRREDIAPERLAALNAGTAEAKTLVEMLAIDHAALLRAVRPDLVAKPLSVVAGEGITRRMAAKGVFLLREIGLSALPALAAHPSDTVRGWAAYMIGAASLDLPARFDALRPLADDSNSGVREWAWLALRSAILAQTEEAIRLLTPWTADPSANLRRFASEATRPRGVWSAHLPLLRRDPARGEAILEPLRADPARYVQDSVANWINDAAKDRPDWAKALCARWRRESPSLATARICKRGLRTIQA